MPYLIDVLTKTNVVNFDATQQTINSISQHVEHLLNTRQGSVNHLPDLGLPDITEIYQDLPSSSHELMAAIKQCLEKYEPRLSQIRVYQQPSTNAEGVLNLLIEARLVNQQSARFITLFANDGQAQVDYKH